MQKSIFKASFFLVSLNITKSIGSFTSEAVSTAILSWRGKSGPNTSGIKKGKYPKSASLDLQYLKGAVLDTAISCYLLKNSAEDSALSFYVWELGNTNSTSRGNYQWIFIRENNKCIYFLFGSTL